jgi:hypothetical protein
VNRRFFLIEFVNEEKINPPLSSHDRSMGYDFNQEGEKMAKNNDQTAYWLDQICPGHNALSFDEVPELVKTEEFCYPNYPDYCLLRMNIHF